MLQAAHRPFPDATLAIGKIYPLREIALTFEPMIQFYYLFFLEYSRPVQHTLFMTGNTISNQLGWRRHKARGGRELVNK